MKTKNFIRPLVIALVLLLIPLFGTLLGSGIEGQGWYWTPWDFILMGSIIYIAGLFFEFFATRSSSLAYKAGAGLAVLTAFLILWVTLAVRIIGDDNPVNLLYYVLILVGLIGAFISRFKPLGMMRAALVTAVVQIAIPTIAVIFFPTFDFSPGVLPVFGMNAVLALMWIASALLFRSAAGTNKVQVA
ncbi:MAG: hypothetical protein K0S38_263 [Candidatus Paceibacter sp.]|jgi:hypothetical protein|nr:hypothetical protein [Candidatus Paceibacter sp.]